MNLDIDGTIKRKFGSWEHCMHRHLYVYFNLPGQSGFLNDVSVTLIDKTDPKDPTKWEDYWIHQLKNKAGPAKHHWNLMLKMVFRQNLLYFAPLIVYGRTVFGQWFLDIISKFLLFPLLLLLFCWCCCCCFRFRYFIIIIIYFQ